MTKQLPLPFYLSTKADFSKTYISPSNQLLANELQHLSDNSQERLLYLWGNPGSGVSHFLQATVSYLQPWSLCSLQFNQSCLHQPTELLELIEGYDGLWIDDIESICGKADWEQALFTVFNALRESQKILLIGSHLPPRQLPIKLLDLKSRLQWGKVFQLNPLNEDEKIELIRFLSNQLSIRLSDEVISYLIHRVERSMSNLISIFRQLDQASLSKQRKLTIPFVKQVLEMSSKAESNQSI